ncbi:MAG: hypothetical protein IJL39_06850 [Clostridia bacterium]|nr:hypothetical protein [Clostridia bacterium]
MVCAIVYEDDREVRFRRGALYRKGGQGKVRLEQKKLAETEYLLLTLPHTMMQKNERRCFKRAERMLSREEINAVVWSGQTAVMSQLLLPKLLDKGYSTATGRDYAPIYLLPMLVRAASLCGVAIEKRKLAIVDRSAKSCSVELLLHAARLAGEVVLYTDEEETAAPRTEEVFEQTGLAIGLRSQNRVDADLALLLDTSGEDIVRSRIVLDFSARPAVILQGRVFTTTTLFIPAPIAAQLPASFSEVERATLLYLVLGKDGMESFRPGQLMES